MCSSYGYSVVYQGIGDPPAGREDVGCCSQMAVFTRCEEMTEKSTAEATEIQPYSMVSVTIIESELPSNLWYKMHQIPKPKCFSFCLKIAFAQSIEAG